MQYFINGVQVFVETGNNIKTTKDETLDSGSFILQILSTEECYKPDLPVKIIDDNGLVSNFVIVSDLVEMKSKEPLRWSHSITLAQNTRVFSKHQVRNTVFSQPAKPKINCSETCFVVNSSSGTAITINAYTSKSDNEVEIQAKQKIKSGKFSFNLFRFTYTSDNKWAMANDTTSLFDITFQVLKNGSSIGNYTYSNITSLSEFNLSDLTPFVENSVYSISVSSITIYTANSDATNSDKYAIQVKLELETYFYTLYDVLSILREQMALNEGTIIIPVNMPTIEIKKEYIVSSSGYQISIRFKNNNDITSTITYSTAGSFVKTGEISILPNSWSDYVVLGLGTTTENGVVYAYATNTNGTSKTASATYSLAADIQAPLLQWTTDATYGDKFSLTNINPYAVNVYYKFYRQGSPVDYSSVNLEADGVYQNESYFQNCIVEYSYYCVDADGRTSDVITGTRVVGTLPTLTSPTITINSVIKGSTTYTISATITNSNAVSCTLYAKSTNTSYTANTISANGSLTIAFNELVSSGTNGNIIAYLTAENYTASATTTKSWNYVGTKYDLTKNIYYDNVLQSSVVVDSIEENQPVDPNSYFTAISGYNLISVVPSASFTMTSATTISGYYELATSTLAAPSIDVVSNTYNTLVIRVFNSSNSVSVAFSGTFTNDIGDTISLSDSSIASGGHADHTITWASGISYATITGKFSASGYADSDNATSGQINRPSSSLTLSDPTITFSDTIVDNGDGTYTKTSKVYATNTNAVAVSYSAVVDGVSKSGTIDAYTGSTEKFAQIGTYEIVSAGQDTFSVSCSFSASGYTGSSTSTTHSL